MPKKPPIPGGELRALFDVAAEVKDYLSNHGECVFATNARNQPCASTVYYASDGFDVYLYSYRDSGKVQNIVKNPKVAIVVENNKEGPIKSVEIQGKAEIIQNDEEVKKAETLLRERNDHIASGWADPGAVMIRVKPKWVKYTDWSKGYGFSAILENFHRRRKRPRKNDATSPIGER